MLLFVDNLCNVDFSFLDPTRGVVGETWLVSVALEGALDDQGMVCDFGIVKRRLRQFLDQQLDHRLLVPEHAPSLGKGACDDQVRLTWQTVQASPITLRSPAQAVTLIDADTINPESVARWCAKHLRAEFPASVSGLQIRFSAESIDGPYYHYSHGLKKHDGNCQRIAHGHRSKILIWRNGELSPADMAHWANLWRDIYIGTREDLRDSSRTDCWAFAYTAQQGEFFLELPRQQCYLVDSDTTIEHLAQHIAEQLKAASPQDHFRVQAFEGLAKGAIVER